MPQYIRSVQAHTPNNGTEVIFVALRLPSTLAIQIVRVRVSNTTNAGVASTRVLLSRASSLGSGTPITSSAIKKNPTSGSSALTSVQIKDNGIDWLTGTVIDVIDDVAVGGRSNLEWCAIDDDDVIWIDGSVSEFFTVSLNCSANSQDFCVTVEWKEP